MTWPSNSYICHADFYLFIYSVFVVLVGILLLVLIVAEFSNGTAC